MIHDRFYRLQLCTTSASFTDTQQQNVNRKMILALFFLHLLNKNKQHTIVNKINNWNKYSSPTVNNYHGNRRGCWKWWTWKWPTIEMSRHEIDGHENDGHEIDGHENDGHENAGHVSGVWIGLHGIDFDLAVLPSNHLLLRFQECSRSKSNSKLFDSIAVCWASRCCLPTTSARRLTKLSWQ